MGPICFGGKFTTPIKKPSIKIRRVTPESKKVKIVQSEKESSFKIKKKQDRINKKKQEDMELDKIIKRIEGEHIPNRVIARSVPIGA